LSVRQCIRQFIIHWLYLDNNKYSFILVKINKANNHLNLSIMMPCNTILILLWQSGKTGFFRPNFWEWKMTLWRSNNANNSLELTIS
jgi:hypothetical protein